MNKTLRLVLVMSIPAFVFVNIYQTYSYQMVSQSVVSLESHEKAWLEKNKRAIAGIAVLSSPERLGQLAKTKLGLVQKLLQPALRIKIPAQSGTNDG